MAAIMHDCGEAAALFWFWGILRISAVAIGFSCSGATEFSELEFDSALLPIPNYSAQSCSEPVTRRSGWTRQAGERYDDSSSFLGTVLSILTLLPGRNVRK